MASISNDTETKLQAHPLSADPEKCFYQEERNGRYKELNEGTNQIDDEKCEGCLRFVCISDTHDKTDELLNKLPEGDVLIHAGDFTGASAADEIKRFNEFLGRAKSKYREILVIAGNHELSFDPRVCNKGGLKISLFKAFFGKNPLDQQLNSVEAKELLTNCRYIEDESIEIEGIRIYGSPWQPPHYDLAFNKLRGETILEEWNKIPNETDILITHGPPLGIGDLVTRGYHVGCADLLTTVVDRVKPKYHVFGHIHESYGIWNNGITTFINASICDKKYRPVHQPIVFDYKLNG